MRLCTEEVDSVIIKFNRSAGHWTKKIAEGMERHSGLRRFYLGTWAPSSLIRHLEKAIPLHNKTMSPVGSFGIHLFDED